MYIDPRLVTSPKNKLSNLHVIVDDGANAHSVAIFNWEGKKAVGVRWNGEKDNPLGNPQSRGIATWFILPTPIAIPYLENLVQAGSVSNVNLPIVQEYLDSAR